MQKSVRVSRPRTFEPSEFNHRSRMFAVVGFFRDFDNELVWGYLWGCLKQIKRLSIRFWTYTTTYNFRRKEQWRADFKSFFFWCRPLPEGNERCLSSMLLYHIHRSTTHSSQSATPRSSFLLLPPIPPLIANMVWLLFFVFVSATPHAIRK
jgi:hypothetical protein